MNLLPPTGEENIILKEGLIQPSHQYIVMEGSVPRPFALGITRCYVDWPM